MLSQYCALLVRARARRLALGCALAWLAFTGYALAIILAVHTATGSFRVAGGAVAAFSAGSGLIAPARGRLIDSHGARAVGAFAIVHACAAAGLITACALRSPAAILVASSAVAGALAPPLIATARMLWADIAGPELARPAHALNASLADGAQLGRRRRHRGRAYPTRQRRRLHPGRGVRCVGRGNRYVAPAFPERAVRVIRRRSPTLYRWPADDRCHVCRRSRVIGLVTTTTGGTPVLEKVFYTSVLVSDQDKALAFYTDVLGLEKRVENPTPDGPRFLTVGVKGDEFQLVLWPGTPGEAKPAMGRPPASITIETDDCHKSVEELKSRGVEFISDVLEFPWGYVAQFQDPDGNRLQLRQGL